MKQKVLTNSATLLILAMGMLILITVWKVAIDFMFEYERIMPRKMENDAKRNMKRVIASAGIRTRNFSGVICHQSFITFHRLIKKK